MRPWRSSVEVDPFGAPPRQAKRGGTRIVHLTHPGRGSRNASVAAELARPLLLMPPLIMTLRLPARFVVPA